MNIVADPSIPFVREAFGPLGDVRLVPGRQINAASVRDADVLLVRSITRVNAALLDGSQVKFVATATIGTDHVDEMYLRERGIGFASAAGSNANSVAEYMVAAMLDISRRNHFRLRDKTLGVVGVGNVGSRVVRYAEAFGMRVLQNDPPRERMERNNVTSSSPSPLGGQGVRRTGEGLRGPAFVSLDRVCAEADIITLHVPLTRAGHDTTFHLFDEERLATLEKHRPILINTSRGAVVDNPALLQTINHRGISGAMLDVWENEPNISKDLLDIVDIGTPHIAGYSFDGKVSGTSMIYRAACKFLGFGAGGCFDRLSTSSAPSTSRALEGATPVAPSWAPPLPPPLVPRLEVVVAESEEDEDVLRRIIPKIYDITTDDAALRRDIRLFDKLRAEYPIRREFSNTELIVRGATDELREKFVALGFKVAR